MADETQIKKGSQGGLWAKLDKNNNRFFSGSIEIPDSEGNIVKHYFNAFINNFLAESPNGPKYRIFLNTPREEVTEIPKPKVTAAKPITTKPFVKPKAKPAPIEEVIEDAESESEEILLD